MKKREIMKRRNHHKIISLLFAVFLIFTGFFVFDVVIQVKAENLTLTLLPTANGYENEWDNTWGGHANWECVAEEPLEAYVYTSTLNEKDNYVIDNVSSDANGTINSVSVYAYVRHTALTGGDAKFRIAWFDEDVGNTPTYSSQFTLESPNGFIEYYDNRVMNLSGGNWTWDDIDKLRAGIILDQKSETWDEIQCNYLYVKVSYTVLGRHEGADGTTYGELINQSQSENFVVMRETFSNTESNNCSFTPSQNYSFNVTLKIPVSTNVKGIISTTNNTGGINANEVNDSDELINNTFWYDAANQFVYIRTINLTTSSTVNWTVNCSYGVIFNLIIPPYLEVGQYFHSEGFISDSNGNAISGMIAETRLLYPDGTDALSVNPKHNCTGGNYKCTFSTATLIPGTYSVSIEFTDPTSGIKFKEGGTLYLSVDPGSGVHVWTALHFTFYNNNTGIGIPSESFRIYASTDTTIDSGDRIYVDLFGVYTGQTIYYRIDDYFDNQIYPTTGSYETLSITSINQYEDIPIDWYSFSVKNMNHSIVWFNMTNGSRLYSTWLFPYEPFYWNVLLGEYNLSMEYYNPETDAYIETKYQNITINHDKYYWIRGYDLRDIILEIQITNTTLGNFVLTINTDISLVNSTVVNITTNIISSLTATETNITTLINSYSANFTIIESFATYFNNTIWGNFTFINATIDTINNKLTIDFDMLNVTVDYIKNSLILNLSFANSTIDYINNTIWNELTFINTSVDEINTRIINVWSCQNSSFGNLENRSTVVFNFYHNKEALGIDRETLKVYVNGSRLIGREYYTYNATDVINLTIKDYYNTTLYQNDITISAPYVFIDAGITFHSWLFGNKNNIDYMISILKQGGSRWWERGIVPQGEREFMIPSGTYALRIYYNDSGVYTEIYNSTLPPSILVNCSKVYVIEGNDLVEVISGLSVIRGQLIEVRTELQDALMPDVTIISRNPPMIYSIYDTEGMAIGSNFYTTRPTLITIATTRVTTYGDYINSTPTVPSNGTIQNGSVTIIRDILYMSGSASWVNITCHNDNTLNHNYSYVPTRLDTFYGGNLTINASDDIVVLRETKFSQRKTLEWKYHPFVGSGPDPERVGYRSAGINVRNMLSIPIFDVYILASFSNKSNPDANTIVVRDSANNVISKRGTDYDVTGTNIHFYLLSIEANSGRSFTIGYYNLQSEFFTYDEVTITATTFEQVVWQGLSFNKFQIQWVNPFSDIFKGALYINLKFNIPTGIKNLRIWDLDNDHEIDDTNFIVGEKFIRIGSDTVGEVPPGSMRSFDVYFSMTEHAEAQPGELHLDTQLYLGITPFLIIFGIGIGFIILGAYFAATDKKERERWKVSMAFGFFLIVTIFIFQAMGL